MIILQCLLEFQNKQDKEIVLDLRIQMGKPQMGKIIRFS